MIDYVSLASQRIAQMSVALPLPKKKKPPKTKEQKREYDRAWKAAHKDKVKENKKRWLSTDRGKENKRKEDKAYRERHKEKINAYNKAWREAHPDYGKKWREAHPDYHKNYNSKKIKER